MTFQFACRKWLSHKDLEPAVSCSLIQFRVSSIVNPESRIQYRVSSNPVPARRVRASSIENRESRFSPPTLVHFRHFRHFSSLYFTLAHFRHFIRRGGFSSLFTNLPAYKAADIYVPIRHYICRESSTNQPFLCKTNPILSAVGGLQMNVNIYNTTDYENIWQRRVRKNKPNSNPIKPNFRKAKMNVNSLITKDYRKKDDFTVRINKPNFVKGPK